MLRILRLLAVLLVIALAGFAIVGVANDRKLGGAGFYSGLDELLKRAAAVREAASPEYQHEVLGSLPTNATAGPVLRLDDHIAEARIVDEPVRNDALAGFEHVFTYDFDTPDELVSAQGMLKPTVRDGVLVVEHVKDDYLHNARPIEIVTDDVGEIIVRAKATKGTHFTLAWSPMAKPELWLRYRVDIPLIADGKFHNYSINARNALRRGLNDPAHPANTAWLLRLIALLKDVLEHVDDLLRIGPLKLDESARHFGRRDVELLHHLDQLAQNVGALGDEKAGGFREGENWRLTADAGEILGEDLLQFLRVGVIESKEIADDFRSRWNIGRIGNDWDRRGPRVLIDPDNLDNVALGRDE